MAKKNTQVIIPSQMGFGFEVQDAAGNEPPFLYETSAVHDALDVISKAYWTSVDTETTGLTDASIPVDLHPREFKQGASNHVRMRTIQVRVPTIRGRSGPRENFAFDVDKLSPKLLADVTNTVLSRKLFIAHNAGFDLYWLRLANNRLVMPELVLDSMLLTRLLQPQLVLRRAELIEQEGVMSAHDLVGASPVAQAAWKSLISGASGGSLADVVLAMFGVVVDKTYQKPNNWTGLLGFEHYDYAIDDVVWADRIMCNLLNIADDGDIYLAYMGARARNPKIRLVEPQVSELVELREHGMPISQEVGVNYVKQQRGVLAKKVNELIELEPNLDAHREALSNPDAGLDDALKQALASAFERRGVALRRTAATGSAQVGEKDLRACRAAQMETSRPLFNAWVAVCRAKKSSNMASDIVGFSKRSPDTRVRSLLSHGPVTGRLSASEPNCQQFPRDQVFRAMCVSDTKPGCELVSVQANATNKDFLSKVAGKLVAEGESATVNAKWLAALYWADKNIPDWPSEERKGLLATIDAQFTHYIVASDFGALDVRVGAALCVRSQREMLAAARGVPVPGPVQPRDSVLTVLRRVARCLDHEKPTESLKKLFDEYGERITELEAEIEALKRKLDADELERKVFFRQRSDVKGKLLPVKIGWRLSQCLMLGMERGEPEYSALRDAFVADIDIHTFTGMKLTGRDPMKEFEGLTPSERKALEKKLKKELGPRRQQGKIANLSLLYGMADAGFQEAAARGYDEHWTMQEAHDIRALWMNAYPEVELWHLWTECLQAGVVYVPEVGKERLVRTSWWMAKTLAGRDIVAYGLNAALSYQDQSTGADILGMIMHQLKKDYSHIFDLTINQVHDELVLALPIEKHDEYLEIVEQIMVECANSLTMPYGVPCAVSPASGVIWIKD